MHLNSLSYMLKNGKKGDNLIVLNKKHKDVTAVASNYNRKVSTERVFITYPGKTPTIEVAIKVTILE